MDDVLDDLASRLRGLTGQVIPESTLEVPQEAVKTSEKPEPHAREQRLKRGSLLVMQQSLRRHPALQLLFAAETTTLRSLYNAIHDAILVQPSTSSTKALNYSNEGSAVADKSVEKDSVEDEEGSVEFMLEKVNKFANNVEQQRLEAFSTSAEYVSATVRQARREVMQLLGFDNLPRLYQNNTALQCPWNVLFTLHASYKTDVIITEEPQAWKLYIPNATIAMRQCLDRIHSNRYDVIAWRKMLLHLSRDFPIGAVRNLWQAALILFPTSRCLVNEYVQREVEHLAKRPKLWECQDLSDAESVYLAHLRLLNIFYKHLRITFSTDLYMQFFQFITEFVQVDERTLDSLYRNCLREDVGFLPTSTLLWRSYMNWRLARIRDAYRRREFSRQMYKRILQTPLFNLRSVKEMYDAFVVSETRTRAVLDEKAEIDKLFLRANAEAAELQQYSEIFTEVYNDKNDINSGSSNVVITKQDSKRFSNTHGHNHKFSGLLTFLPRPLCCRKDAFDEIYTSKYDTHEVDEDELLLHELWNNLLDRTTRLHVSELSTSTLQHYTRCRGLFKMRACTFLYHFNCWAEWIYYIIYEQPFLTTHERSSMVHDAIALLRRFSFSEKCLSVLFCADVHLTHLGYPDRALGLIRSQLVTERTNLLNQIKRWQLQEVNLNLAINNLETIVTLAVNWMRVTNQVRSSNTRHLQHPQQMQREEQINVTVSHVAEFVIHKIDLLSLTMAVLKRALQGQEASAKIIKPTFIVRPFNVFCHKWIELVLIRERNVNVAVLILSRWIEHLKLLLHSASERRWSATECGADSLLFSSCQQIITADGTRCNEVFALMNELARLVEESSHSYSADDVHMSNVTFLYQYTQLQHHYFASPTLYQLPFAIRCSESFLNLPCKGCTPVRFTTKCNTCNSEPEWNYTNLVKASECSSSGLLMNNMNNSDAIDENDDDDIVNSNLSNLSTEHSAHQSSEVQELLPSSVMENSLHQPLRRIVPDENSWVVFDVNKTAANVYSDKTSKVVMENRAPNRSYRENVSFRTNNYTWHQRNRYRNRSSVYSSNNSITQLPSNRDCLQDGVIVECVNFPTLASWLEKLTTNKESNVASVSRSIPVKLLEELVYELPTLYEYMYDFSHVQTKTTSVEQKSGEGLELVLPTAQWLVKYLQSCGAIHQQVS